MTKTHKTETNPTGLHLTHPAVPQMQPKRRLHALLCKALNVSNILFDTLAHCARCFALWRGFHHGEHVPTSSAFLARFCSTHLEAEK